MVRFAHEDDDGDDLFDSGDEYSDSGDASEDAGADSSVFGNKLVHILNCKFCTRQLCTRAMRALLLADLKVELFSTDGAPLQGCALVNDAYLTGRCQCVISDVACLGW